MQTTDRFSDVDLVEHRDWRDTASCRDTDPDLFFPVGATGLALEQIKAAKMICRTCDCRIDCLEYALTTNQEAGIWGGTAEDERRALRKSWIMRRRRPA